MKKLLISLSVLIFLCFSISAQQNQDSVSSNGTASESETVANQKTDSLAQVGASQEESKETEQVKKEEGKEEKKNDESLSNVRENVSENVGDALTTVKDIISVSKILTIFVVIFFVWLFIQILDWIFEKLVERFNRHRLKILRVQPILKVLIWVFATYVLIETLFNPTAASITAIFASSAVALGFASQDILKNIFGGLLILMDRPFQIGDRINIKDQYGEVKNIGLRNTQINTLDDSMVTIPNSAIISDTVSNANSGALDCMVVVDLWLPIDINVEKARKIAEEAAITSRYLNIDKPVVILFFDHFTHMPSTNVKIKAYVLDARYEKAFAGDVTEAAKKAFREASLYEIKKSNIPKN